jgi:hypothetical protein
MKRNHRGPKQNLDLFAAPFAKVIYIYIKLFLIFFALDDISHLKSRLENEQ